MRELGSSTSGLVSQFVYRTALQGRGCGTCSIMSDKKSRVSYDLVKNFPGGREGGREGGRRGDREEMGRGWGGDGEGGDGGGDGEGMGRGWEKDGGGEDGGGR